MNIAGIDVEVVRKAIKNLHLAVYPPEGRVRLAAPEDVAMETLELYLISKLGWIRKQQRRFHTQNRQTPRQYVDRESHYFMGRRYLLRVHEGTYSNHYSKVEIRSKQYVDMYVPEGFDTERRAWVMNEWYRKELKKALAELVPKWERILGVKANKVKVQRLKTKWGSCNPDNANLLFNLELAKKPVEAIEYVVAHELVHLLERTHNDRFQALMNTHIPNWQGIRQELNEMIL